MKKIIINIISIIVLLLVMISSLSVMEYYFTIKNKRIPLIAIKTENKKEQFFQYNALFYKVYKCYSNDIYLYAYKDELPKCPQIILFDNNNNYTNSLGTIISKKDYQMLLTLYNHAEIEKFNSTDVSNSLILSKYYGESFHNKVNTINDFYYDGELVSVHTFQNFEINDIYSNYGWVMQYKNSKYYKCAKTDGNGKFLFSDYINKSCSNNWNYYLYSDQWCNIAKTSNKENIKNIRNEFCK